jgi:hypothetical protein
VKQKATNPTVRTMDNISDKLIFMQHRIKQS